MSGRGLLRKSQEMARKQDNSITVIRIELIYGIGLLYRSLRKPIDCAGDSSHINECAGLIAKSLRNGL